MENHKFSISISGDKLTATNKAKAIVVLASYLDVKTLVALAEVVKNDPAKVNLAKQFLGV